MVVLLLIMLISYCGADEVCFNFTNYEIEITINNITVKDKPVKSVSCSVFEVDCLLDCQFAQITNSWFNGSFGCLEASISTSYGKMKIYVIKHNTMCTLYPCDNASIANLMESLSVDVMGLMKLSYIRTSCALLFSQQSRYQDLRKSYLRKECGMIHKIMESSTSSFTSYDLKDVSINVTQITRADLDTEDPRIDVPAAQLLPQMEPLIPEIWVPVIALHKLPEKKRVIGTVSYLLPDQFKFEPVNISSVVIRIELLEGMRLHHLNPPIEIIFRNVVQTVDKNYTLACHYFDEHDSSATFEWQTHGCETKTLGGDIICSCNHMTAFAVLLIRIPIDTVHWRILSVLSYIGCGLSAFFTALSIVIFFFSYKKADPSVSIHTSLSGALFLLNLTFILTEWGARAKPDWVCVLLAAAMHYSLLCSFTWMALEAVHLYVLLIKVFNTNYRNYLLKLSVVGWGIPAVIVSVSVAVKDSDLYGRTETQMADSNQTSAICWITEDSYFYSVNLVYFTIIFMFNAGILTTVASSIFKMKKKLGNMKGERKGKRSAWKDADRFSESCKSGLTLLGLTCLMGTTWGLVFLGSGYVNYPILYLFCIFNSTQGFFIFIWICLSTIHQRK